MNRFRQWYAGRYHGQLEQEAAAASGAAADMAAVWKHERALTEALLRSLRGSVEAAGAQLVVMPVPALPGSGEPERRLAELAAFLEREDFVWLDLRPDVELKADAIAELYYPVDGHWTAAGHALAGDRLAAKLREMLAEG